MTFNIRTSRGLDGRHHWWFRRRAAVAAIRRPRPDVVALQEVRPGQLRYLRRRLREYVFAAEGREAGGRRGEHCAVLVRRDRFRLERFDRRWFSDTPDVAGSIGWGNRVPRIAVRAWLTEVRHGWRFGVVATHLDHTSRPSRERSADALARWLADEPSRPWVVMGDLNVAAGDSVVQRLLDAGLRDALGHLPALGPGIATHHSFTGSHDGSRIDYVLVPRRWSVIEAVIRHDRPGGRLPSDHWPVVVRVEPDD